MWQARALCAEIGSELWFLEKGGDNRRAKDICEVCPVKDACLDDALRGNIEHGIWGGLTALERRALKRKMSRRK